MNSQKIGECLKHDTNQANKKPTKISDMYFSEVLP